MRGPKATTFVPRPVPPRKSLAAYTRPYDPNSKRPSCCASEGASVTTCPVSLARPGRRGPPGTDGALVSDVTGASGGVDAVGFAAVGFAAGAGVGAGAGVDSEGSVLGGATAVCCASTGRATSAIAT